jgi:hypothetical protein
MVTCTRALTHDRVVFTHPPGRVVDIIEFLGERRGMPIRLSDIVQALGLTRQLPTPS